MANIERLKTLLDFLIANTDTGLVGMSNWGASPTEYVEEAKPGECGTTACAAGWTCALFADAKLDFSAANEGDGYTTDTCVTPDRKFYDIEKLAYELLGYDAYENYHPVFPVFYSTTVKGAIAKLTALIANEEAKLAE